MFELIDIPEKNRKVSMQKNLDIVEARYGMGGLSDGIYGDYARDVALAFAYDLLCKLRKDGMLKIGDKELYDLLNDGSIVEQIDA